MTDNRPEVRLGPGGKLTGRVVPPPTPLPPVELPAGANDAGPDATPEEVPPPPEVRRARLGRSFDRKRRRADWSEEDSEPNWGSNAGGGDGGAS